MDPELFLEKSVWTDSDLDTMNWHDNKIHAVALDGHNHQLLLDIDYICKWVKRENYFLFWVAPSTLIFRNVFDVTISTETTDLVILEIKKSNATKPRNADHIEELNEYKWTIETTAGEITFKSVGFTQLIRRHPTLLKRQELNLSERGGYSFNSKLEN